jgi:membrane protease YdiL (CAAX protease family)
MQDDPEPRAVPSARAAHLRTWALYAIALGALACLVFGALRLRVLAQGELTFETETQTLTTARARPSATRISARLAEVKLARDQQALFELCAKGDLAQLQRDALSILIVHREAKRLMLRVPLDAAHLAHVKRAHDRSCLLLGSGRIEHTGTYHLEAVWPEAARASDLQLSAASLALPIWVRTQAKPRLDELDLACVVGLGGALLSLLVLCLFTLPTPSASDAARGGVVLDWRAAAPLLALGCMYLAVRWPSQGALQTLAKGVGLFGLQVALAWLLAAQRRSTAGSTQTQVSSDARLQALALTRGARPPLASLGALLAVPALVLVARLSLRLVPSTGEAPIETFISWPSGMLAAALLGVLLPAGEELFFRGYVLGALLRYGKAVAAIGSTLAFGLMHAEQSWGNWGGLFAVFFTGAILAALRLLGRSTVLCAISHVAYNLTLSTSSILAAIDA